LAGFWLGSQQVRAQAANGGRLELVELDLAALASVRACAEALISIGELFDLDIANAGVMACPKSHTFDKARLNGHRRGCRVGEEGLRCRDARVAIRH
jgi:hypothetical protein